MPEQKNYDLGEVMQQAAADRIWAVRGRSIQSYASLEQSLCALFAYCGDIDPKVAGIIFFRISSTQVRNDILEKLIRRKFGSVYNLFWNSYLKELRPIDIKRNEVVHWNMITLIGDDGVSLQLRPPNFAGWDENTPQLLDSDLVAFMEKCGVFGRLANMFHLATSIMTGAEAQPWLDVFKEPLVYPLPDGHPLNPRPTTP
ncbi:hypothetical protein [Hyphomicrobium sp.]|uniref:hypothetical protein n=1 Tax=Hyphomicrobium sp. TaxID=82 RepID=UPI000FA54BD4|nr:hypothetical protein [Hyphomicrobium sp.]RUP00314.1 MAG: hypothetical protein EKK30_01750 [Hyphomicrobium sp.]